MQRNQCVVNDSKNYLKTNFCQVSPQNESSPTTAVKLHLFPAHTEDHERVRYYGGSRTETSEHRVQNPPHCREMWIVYLKEQRKSLLSQQI